MQRTEDDIIVQAPLTVVLGGKEYPIKLLVVRDSRAWRQLVARRLSAMSKMSSVSSDDEEAFSQALSSLLGDEVIDLFFAYAKDLDREEIESIATEQEIATAFEKVYSIAFPLAASLTSNPAMRSPLP